MRTPDDLCPEHRQIWIDWRYYPDGYDPRHPREAGGGTLMDNRTSHEGRRADWVRLAADQMAITERICRSGRSPQCTPREVS